MKSQKISIPLVTIVLVIFSITVGALAWQVLKSREVVEQRQQIIDVKKPATAQTPASNQPIANHYSNSDYGFSLDLPYTLDKYVVQVSPNTITRIAFQLPATNQKFLEYTGHALANAFDILAYPKSEIATIKKECEQGSLKHDSIYEYECKLNSEQPIAENDIYSFYYLKGGSLMKAYPPALEDVEYKKSENAIKSFKSVSASLIFNPAAWHVYTDNDHGFEMEYPMDWHAGGLQSPSIYKQDLVHVFSTSGQISDKINGSLLFGKYNIYNDKLTGSIDGNVKYLNSKINIVGSKSSFKEVKIANGRAFYNTKQSTIASNQRDIFIIGKNIILNGNVSVATDEIDMQELAKFADILSHFKFLHIPQTDKNNSFEKLKISSFENWKTYSEKSIDINIRYPLEFHMSTYGGSIPGVIFYYLNPDNLKRSTNGYSLASLRLSLERKKNALQHIDDFKNILNNLKQEQIQVNGVSANKLSYTDASNGEILYKILIQRGSDLIVVAYAGGSQFEDTFNKMLFTLKLF